MYGCLENKEIYALPDGEGAELIDGKIFSFAVFLNQDDLNYVEPDLSIICDRSKLDEKGCHSAPDWVIEVVSPSSKSRDYMEKLFKYHTAGVRKYWIVDPEKQRVMVYWFEHDVVEQYDFGTDIPVGIYEGFHINLLL